jgi:hypothetical protein
VADHGVDRALVQRVDGAPELRALAAELARRGVDVQWFTAKQLHRRRLALEASVLVAGEIPIVEGALKALGTVIPERSDYPDVLAPWLRRRVWTSTVGAVCAAFAADEARPMFVKPRGRLERFTGRVVDSPNELGFLFDVSRHQELWCSERVRFVSEHRVFVVNGIIVGVRHYAGDAEVTIDRDVVDEAVQTFERSGEPPRGYGIDFGVLDDGCTALVEVNDGYGLGSYGLDPSAYTDLTIARWVELVSGQRR